VVIGPLEDPAFDTQMLETMVDSLVEPIWRRHYTLEMCAHVQCLYQLRLGSSLLCLGNLKKRIQGIKYINEAIRVVRQTYAEQRLLPVKDLVQALRDLDVMEHIFGEHTHYQLVHRSQDLIRLLFNEKEVKESEIDMIWTVCGKQGQQIKLEIYKIVLEVLRAAYSCMTDSTKEHFIDKIAAMHPSQLIEKDIELVVELGKKGGVAYRKPEGFVEKAAQFLWSVAVLEKPYPRATLQTARKRFCEQVSAWDDGLKEAYVAQCLDNIGNNRLPLQNLKIALKLIEKMNCSSYAAQQRTRQDFAEALVETQDFDALIVADLSSYVEYANSLAKKGELTVENHKSLEMGDNHPFTHFKNLKSRLKRLRALLLFARTRLKPELMEQIWDILVQKSELRENDQNIFFNWFKTLLGKEQKKLLTEELMADLFRKKIVPSDLSMLKSLRVNGLECVVRLFVLVNEQQGNVLDLDPASAQSDSSWQQPSTGYQAGSGGQSSYGPHAYQQDNSEAHQAKSRFNRFRVNILPQDLEGIHILWTLLATCDTGNSSLFFMVQRTLINIYSNFSEELAPQKQFIDESFIEQCLACLQSLTEDSTTKTDKEKRESLRCISQMMTTFFEGSEQRGIGQMRLHRQLEEGAFLQKIVVESKLPIRKGVDANFLEINTSASMTVWELKQLVARFTHTSPLCFTLKRGDSKKPELREFRHCKLLSDLKFVGDEETLTVMKASPPDVPKVPLLDAEGDTVPELKAIVSTWFETYSVTMSREEIVEVSERGPPAGRPDAD